MTGRLEVELERMNRNEELADNLSSIRTSAIVIPSSPSNVTCLRSCWFNVTVTELQPDHLLCNLVLIIPFGNSHCDSPCPLLPLKYSGGKFAGKEKQSRSLADWRRKGEGVFALPLTFPFPSLLPSFPLTWLIYARLLDHCQHEGTCEEGQSKCPGS